MVVSKCIYMTIINLCCRNKINDGNKNKLRTIEAQIVQKLKNNERQPKLLVLIRPVEIIDFLVRVKLSHRPHGFLLPRQNSSSFEVFSLKFPKIWVGYVFFKWYFEKKVGRSGDGKRNNLLGWP